MQEQEQIFFNNLHFSYIIRKPKSKSLRAQSVYMLFRIQGKQYKINTGGKVIIQNWNGGKLSVHSLMNVNNNVILLKIFNSNRLAFLKLKQYLCTCEDKQTNIDAIVSMFFPQFKNKIRKTKDIMKKKKEIYLSELLFQAIQEKKETTKKTYNGYIDAFSNFLSENNIEDIASNGTKDTLLRYQQYLISNGNKPTGINNRISVLTKLLKTASKNPKFNYTCDWSIDKVISKEHKENLVETYFILTDAEINQLYFYQDSDNKPLTPKQEYVKDCFILECLTGQRIGDCQRLIKDEDLPIIESKGLKFISYRDTKTRSQCLIPIDNTIKEILDKYKDTVIKVSESSINKILKLMCERLNMNREVSVIKDNALINVPLYEAIHSHVGRHTFITRMYLKGMDKEQIIKITGHKDTKMIDTIYLNLSKQDKADMLAKSINSMNNSEKKQDNKDDDKHDDTPISLTIGETNNVQTNDNTVSGSAISEVIQLAKENMLLKQELSNIKQQIVQPIETTQEVIQPIEVIQPQKLDKRKRISSKVEILTIISIIATVIIMIPQHHYSMMIVIPMLLSSVMFSVDFKNYVLKYI